MSTVRIALANLRYPETPDDSVALATDAIADAARASASVICFPEVYVPGYRAPGKPVPPPDPDFLTRAWATIASATAKAGVTVVLGTERVVDGQPRITTLVINADGSYAGFQDKVQLDPSEEGPYVPGAGRQIFTAGPLTFGVSICHEGFRYPETVRWSARHGAHVVFHPHFSWAEPGSFRPESFGDPRNTFHEKSVLCRAAENSCFVASVNCATEGSPTTSVVARPDGSVLAWQPYGQEGLLVVDIDTTEATGLLASRYRPDPDSGGGRRSVAAINPFFIVSDLQLSIRHYIERFGFELDFQGPDDDPFYGRVSRDGIGIMLKAIVPGVTPIPNHTRHEWARWDAYVYTPDPDALFDEFRRRGASFVKEVSFIDEGLWGFEVTDADGYVLAFAQPRNSARG